MLGHGVNKVFYQSKSLSNHFYMSIDGVVKKHFKFNSAISLNIWTCLLYMSNDNLWIEYAVHVVKISKYFIIAKHS